MIALVSTRLWVYLGQGLCHILIQYNALKHNKLYWKNQEQWKVRITKCPWKEKIEGYNHMICSKQMLFSLSSTDIQLLKQLLLINVCPTLPSPGKLIFFFHYFYKTSHVYSYLYKYRYSSRMRSRAIGHVKHLEDNQWIFVLGRNEFYSSRSITEEVTEAQ